MVKNGETGTLCEYTVQKRSDVKKCLMHEKLVKAEIPDLTENHTAHEKTV